MDKPSPVTMPTWPAWLMLAFAAACAYPAMTSEAPAEAESLATYTARGQEPGWAVTVGPDRIDYTGDYGDTKISVDRPEAHLTFNGHRYDTDRLTIDVTHARCNDAMSGLGFADRVTVIADGIPQHGCGGERRSQWDI